MKKYIHIRCKVPTTISINGEKINQNNPDIMCNNDFYIGFFPALNTDYLPCAISTHSNTNSDSIKKIPFKDNHLEIIYDPISIPKESKNTLILNKKYGNYIISINNSNSKSYINITSPLFSHSSVVDKLANIDFKCSDGHIILIGTTENSEKYLLIFNSKMKKILVENIFKQIETNKTEIKALKKSKLNLGYGTVFTFNLSTKKLTKYNVYTTQETQFPQEELIPLHFLESLKYKDFKKAVSYLENQNVKNSQLETFFGEIEEIYFNGYCKDINYTIFTDKKYKNFTFKINNNKIVDIEENQI